MTTDERQENHDPQIEALFARAEAPAADEEFTRSVMQRTRRFRWRLMGGVVAGLAGVVAILLAFSVPLGAGALWVVDIVATPLLPIPEGWWGWVLAPVNTLGTALAVLYKGVRMAARRAIGARYVD